MSEGHEGVENLTMRGFSALVRASEVERIRKERTGFYGARVAFHADANMVKKWEKQWATPQSSRDTSEERARRDTQRLLRGFGK